MRTASTAFFSLCVLVGASMAIPAAAQLVVNGDFENTTNPGTVPDGWSVLGGNPVPPRAFHLTAVVPRSSGEWALDLGPSGRDVENGGRIFQTFVVPKAGVYDFRFDYSNELNSPALLADFFWSLSGRVQDGQTLRRVGGGYVALTRRYTVSEPGNVTLTFGDIVGNGGLDAIIDNVSFAAVPLPPSAWLLGLATIALASRGRRRLARS